MGKKKTKRPARQRPILPPAGATPEETAGFAAKRCSAYVKEVHERYPNMLGFLHQMAKEKGGPRGGEWPDWCWLPMAAAVSGIAEMTGPMAPFGDMMKVAADGARVTALATWRLTKGVYRLDHDRLAAKSVDRIWEARGVPANLRIDKKRFLNGLPQHCVYVVLPTPPHPLEHPIPLGVFIHLEHDLNSGRPELRFLIDHDGTWEGLEPVWVALDRPTLEAAARESISPAMPAGLSVPAAFRALLPGARSEETEDGLVKVAGMPVVLAWPLAEMVTDPEAVMTRYEMPGERPEPAAPDTTGGSPVWPIATAPTHWVLSAEVPRPTLRSL
ncbi:hypothetical protein ACIQWY_30020 [Streptomyces albidoflavus]